MKRKELEDAIRHATRVTEQREVLVIGSQAILGSYDETQLPERATLSEEVDIAPITDDEEYTLATLIDANLGEWSQFHLDHGFYVQGRHDRGATEWMGGPHCSGGTRRSHWRARPMPGSTRPVRRETCSR